jgi:hypothetical protein
MVVAALGMWACSDPLPTPAATVVPIGSAGNGLWSDRSSAPAAGPDLGETWTTEPDPDAFITLDGGSQVAPDQFLSPPPTQQAGPTVDCSNMPEPGTIAYAQWALKCKPIAP